MNLQESIRKVLREENTLPNLIRRRFSEEELYKLVSNVERTFETHRISQQHREDVIDAEVDDFIMNSVYYGEFEDFDDEIYQEIYNLYREPLVDYIKSKIDMNLQESIKKVLREELKTKFFLRRVTPEEVARYFSSFDGQVFFETETYEDFKYQLVLKSLEEVMWQEYKMGWEDLPEQEEIDYVNKVAEMYDDKIRIIYNKTDWFT